jgi:protein-L-isoaspartate(D-aspartate) O-methyltransferase
MALAVAGAVAAGLLADVRAQAASRQEAAAAYAEERARMVAEQIEARGIEDPSVLEAMRRVPRHAFVQPGSERLAYTDQPLPISAGQTISQPYIVALMTTLAEVRPGDRVLEIGTGSGYQAAVLAQLTGQVYSIEIIEELAVRADETLRALGADVQVRVGDGFYGWPEAAPFDAILVTAAAPRVPERLLAQLATGGRLVIPLEQEAQAHPADPLPDLPWLRPAQELAVFRKAADGTIAQERIIPVRFVPMTGAVESAAERE